MIADKALDVALELLERAKVFQDRKADRLQARADRKNDKATDLRERGKALHTLHGKQVYTKRKIAKRITKLNRRASALESEAQRLEARVERLLAE